ncbi:MAG: condensation domain-containing protein, partial [Gemmatimonadaceae bacterium]
MSAQPRQPANLDAVLAVHGDVQVMLPSYGQRRFFVLDQFDDEAAYTIPIGVRLHGKLDIVALQRSLDLIVERHETLRTIFALDGDEPVQVILPSVQVVLRRQDLRLIAADTRENALVALADHNSNEAFDLGVGPLMRATLVQLTEDEHVLLLSLHHITADGSSVAVLFAELEAAYTAFLTGTAPVLSTLTLQYADVADWQRRVMEGGGATKQIEYWTNQLRDLTPLELPTDRPRPVAQTQNGSHREILIDGEVAEAIRDLARREGATPYMAFLAAFFALLHRYTAQNDLVVGSITSGRLRPEVEPLIGLFLNTLAIRVNVSGEATFAELLRTVRDSATAAYRNQDVPFEFVVDAVRPARDRSRSPIFQVAFQLLEVLARDLHLPGLTASRVSGSKLSAKFDLTLMLHAAPKGGIRAVLEYNTDLFDGETIDRMLSHYATLLTGIGHDSTASVSRLPLMRADEYALVTETYNQSAAAVPGWCLPDRVLAQAAATPSAIAVRATDATLSYGELAIRVQTLAHHLTAQAGIEPGDRVAVFMDRTSSMVVALLAVNACGAAYVPLDTAYPSERTAYVLGDAGVRAILTDTQSAANLPPTVAPVLLADALCTTTRDGRAPLPTAAIDQATAAYVIYTSGSTGKPKGVAVPHRALTNFLGSMAATPGLSARDTVVAVTTISFDIAGLELWLPLVVGATVTIASRAVTNDGNALRKLVDETAADNATARVLMQATPATWLLLLEAGW